MVQRIVLQDQILPSRCGCGMAVDQHPTEAQRPLKTNKFLSLPGADDETTNDSDEVSKVGRDRENRPFILNRWIFYD